MSLTLCTLAIVARPASPACPAMMVCPVNAWWRAKEANPARVVDACGLDFPEVRHNSKTTKIGYGLGAIGRYACSGMAYEMRCFESLTHRGNRCAPEPQCD